MANKQIDNDDVDPPLSSEEIVTEKNFLKELIMTNDPNAEDCNPSDLVLDSWESGKDGHHSNNFVWDLDASTESNSALGTNLSDVPMYHKSKFSTVLEEFDQEEAKKHKDKRQAQTCFNCMGDHTMNECPKPRNHEAINKNRREFMNKYGGFNKQATRYHLSEDQLYSHMKPGKLSSELRKALSLKKNQLPRHIYMMRRLGYPPAWLEEAKVPNSGLTMFDSHGKNNKDESVEKYDVEKIVDYPGFNVEPSSNIVDESGYYGCPTMIPNQSKKAMIKYLQDLNDASKHSSRKNPHKDVITVVDMEAESDETGSGVKSGESKSPSPVDMVDPGTEPNERSSSPSLADLETQKQLLMKELEGATPDKSSNIGKVKHVDLGTPILKSASPYSRIPAADNFSQGICDVINFENLPGTTGHFSRLNKIINKIREGKETNMEEDNAEEDKSVKNE